MKAFMNILACLIALTLDHIGEEPSWQREDIKYETQLWIKTKSAETKLEKRNTIGIFRSNGY